MNVQISGTVEYLSTIFLTHLDSLIWYNVALNYYKNKLFFPEGICMSCRSKKRRLNSYKYLNPFCLSVHVKQFYGALQAFSVLEKDEEVNAVKPNLKMQMIFLNKDVK